MPKCFIVKDEPYEVHERVKFTKYFLLFFFMYFSFTYFVNPFFQYYFQELIFKNKTITKIMLICWLIKS